MLQVITAILFAGTALRHPSSKLATFVKPKVAVTDLFELLDHKLNIDSAEVYGTRPAKLMDTPTLRGLDLSILAGKKVALVGASGSGKSTVIRLGQRFYDLNSGSLHVEGRATINIAHRLPTAQGYDCIVVVKLAKMIEMGIGEELLELKGYYYCLVMQQQLTKEEE